MYLQKSFVSSATPKLNSSWVTAACTSVDAIMSRLHSFRCTGYQSVNESLTNCVPWCILCFTVWLHCIYLTSNAHIDCYSSCTSPGPCSLTIGEKKWRLQYSTCTFWFWSAFVLRVWTRRLEQSFSGALLPSPRRFVGWLIRHCLQLTPGHLRALCFIGVTCLMFFHFYSAFITVRHSIYIDMSTLLSAAVHVL